MDAPLRELSGGALGFFVALLVGWQIIFCACALGGQSSCNVLNELCGDEVSSACGEFAGVFGESFINGDSDSIWVVLLGLMIYHKSMHRVHFDPWGCS